MPKVSIKDKLANAQKKRSQSSMTTDVSPRHHVIQQVKPIKKVGRPSHKDPDKDYGKMYVEIEQDLLTQIKVLSVTTGRTINHIVEEACREYVEAYTL